MTISNFFLSVSLLVSLLLSGGSAITQAHKYKDFTFTTYSPVAFRFFREAFQIKAEDYLVIAIQINMNAKLNI